MFDFETYEDCRDFYAEVMDRYADARACGVDCDGFCDDHCPYAEMCERGELYWGCGVWKECMGDDL